MFVRIEAPHFVAGIEVSGLSAPILHYMRTWKLWDILVYCRKKKWKYILYEEFTTLHETS